MSMSSREEIKAKRGPIILTAITLIFFFAIFFTLSPVFTVNQGELGIVLRFGRIVKIAEPGLNFKIPFTDNAVIMSTRTEKRVYKDLRAYSRDVQEASIFVSVNHRIRPDAIQQIYTQFGTTYVDRVMDPIVPQRLKEVFGQYQATTVVSDRVRMGELIEERIRTSVPDGIIIESVQVENIDFSDAYEKAIEGAAQAEADVRKSRNELEREKVEAEKKIVQAQAQAAQIKERAIAEAEAIRLKGDAEAKTIAAKARAFLDNPGYTNLIAVEKWNGALPQTMLPGSAMPFIPVPHGASSEVQTAPAPAPAPQRTRQAPQQ